MAIYNIWLVVWNIFLCSIIYGMSSFPLTFMFFKMVKTTKQRYIYIIHNDSNRITIVGCNQLNMTVQLLGLHRNTQIFQHFGDDL